MDIYHVQDAAYWTQDLAYRQGNHAEDMLMVYLPKEKILVNADLYSPPAGGPKPPSPNTGMLTLYQNIRQLKLDVAQHVPIHGRLGTNEEFLRIAGKTPRSIRAVFSAP